MYGLRGTACAGACLDAKEQREHVGETQEEVGKHRESDAPGDRHISALGLLCAQHVKGTVGQLQYSQDVYELSVHVNKLVVPDTENKISACKLQYSRHG